MVEKWGGFGQQPRRTMDPHFRPKNHAARWRRMAAHLRACPSDLAIALENLERWERWGRVHPGPIQEWRRRILDAQSCPGAMEEFVSWLEAENHHEEPLKSCSPFVGIALGELDSSVPS